MNLISCAALAAALCISVHAAAAAPVKIVAAENFYADVARQIGGAHVQVTSILNNPDQDPHLFEASPSVGRALTHAKIVVYNGADYDPWMDKLLSASKASDRRTIVTGQLAHKQSGDNPHLWYDPSVMPLVAKELATTLEASDPPNAQDYAKNLQSFLAALKPIDARIKAIKAKYASTPVTATEPVFGYMAKALGLDMRNEHFQLSVMNDTEPSASDTAAFESDLRNHAVKLFIYNSQASDGAATRMLALAKQSGVPVLGVTETAPAGKSFQRWMLNELAAVEKALAH
ncbi:Zinc ABC transporter, periplasmic-binding protein ZnuA [Candidatus Paraburkholderia kirkii UZHbot1]|uniref:Zinc ABC transporter, periplasmic-binding protein ZnuA n=1 Tax=Candidatus Paraburkholderia kirkii UZHbot1 TaxID=1055526 RepID=G4M664_9BURK|nr:Zinc ABC transporter, periplasmic-binding protein ZnuA [Candidatus Paraburkholderia kirkii UZHbot1]